MLECDRTDVSESIDTNKTGSLREVLFTITGIFSE